MWPWPQGLGRAYGFAASDVNERKGAQSDVAAFADLPIARSRGPRKRITRPVSEPGAKLTPASGWASLRKGPGGARKPWFLSPTTLSSRPCPVPSSMALQHSCTQTSRRTPRIRYEPRFEKRYVHKLPAIVPFGDSRYNGYRESICQGDFHEGFGLRDSVTIDGCSPARACCWPQHRGRGQDPTGIGPRGRLDLLPSRSLGGMLPVDRCRWF
jgi:hypothetical protein